MSIRLFVMLSITLVLSCCVSTTAHSKTLTPELLPSESPITIRHIESWPASGEWVDIQLSKGEEAIVGVDYWGLRVKVLPDGEIVEAYEVRDQRSSELSVRKEENEDYTFYLNDSAFSEYGFVVARLLLGEEKALSIAYEAESAPNWVLYLD